MLYILPLEPLEERYTEQWYRWFQEELKRLTIDYEYIDGKMLTNEVETGVVLDAEGTNYWKFTQLASVCELFKSGKVQDGDVFLTMDLWHPGIEAISYMAVLENFQIGLYGFLHAGSYTTEDFAEPMAAWARYHEVGWVEQCEHVFVGTHHHKGEFISKRVNDVGVREDNLSLSERITVTGNPFKTSEVIDEAGHLRSINERENIIIFPHRWDIEKRPDTFVQLMNGLRKLREDFQVVITTSRKDFRSNDESLLELLSNCQFDYIVKAGLSKKEYYQELGKSKVFVSTTIAENFGYCMLEAITLGVVPIAPRKFSHGELLGSRQEYIDRYLYENLDQALSKINEYLDYPISPPLEFAKKYDKSIERMIDIISNDGYGIYIDDVLLFVRPRYGRF